MTVRKPFNRALYEAYDQKAKECLVSLLKKRGHTIVSQTEDRFADVVSQKNEQTYFNEAEVKVAWEHDWPTHWNEIRIPERKKRLLKKYKDEQGVLNFYIFRKDLKQCWRIKDTLLRESNLKEAKGRNIQKGELFFHIPFTIAQLIEV